MSTIMDDITQILGAAGVGVGSYGQGAYQFPYPQAVATTNGNYNPNSGLGPELGPGSGSIYEPYTSGGHAKRFIGVSPTSGRITWFGPLGHPVLWSGDRAAARRWNKYGHGRRSRRGGR